MTATQLAGPTDAERIPWPSGNKPEPIQKPDFLLTKWSDIGEVSRAGNTNIFLVQFFGDLSVRFNCDLPVRCLQLLNQGRKTSYPKDLPDKYRFIILFEVVA